MIALEKCHCLVTGGAGFIGSHLVDQLMSRGCKVRVLDNLSNGKRDNISQHFSNTQFEFSEGSICDPFDVARAIEYIDVVFHLACLGVRHSLTHPFENHRVNTEGTLLLLEASRKACVKRFIHCSSSEVYGTAQSVPMNESHPTLPCTVYGGGKLAGEAYARAYFITYGLPTVIIRPFNTFGPRSHHEGDAGEMIPKSIVRVLNGENILVFGNGDQTRDFTYVEDTAQGLIMAAECQGTIGKTFNIGSRFEISIKELAQRIIRSIPQAKSTIDFTDDRPGDVHRLFADPQAFIDLTGWQSATSFADGLQQTVDFFKNHLGGIEKLFASESGRNWNIHQ